MDRRHTAPHARCFAEGTLGRRDLNATATPLQKGQVQLVHIGDSTPNHAFSATQFPSCLAILTGPTCLERGKSHVSRPAEVQSGERKTEQQDSRCARTPSRAAPSRRRRSVRLPLTSSHTLLINPTRTPRRGRRYPHRSPSEPDGCS